MTEQRFRLARTAISATFILLSFAAVSGISQQAVTATQASAPDIVLEGVVVGSQNQTYIQVPFNVPNGTERVTLTFSYTGKEEHTALDLGLLDPAQLRCWSGGNKSMLTVGLSDATPSCLPGPIPAGSWNVLIGVPNIRSNAQSHYTVQVYFSPGGAVAREPAALRSPLRAGPAWFRGDLHLHTGHSDGQCSSQTGKMVPCPVFFTVDAAARRGLDFIAITDHNATSQYDAMRELEPYFDKVLLIPGREITTFHGHINFLGTTDFLDFRLGGSQVPDMNTLLSNADRVGGLTSINHGSAPSGEICMGCGWTPTSGVDMRLLTAVEAVNGGSEQSGISDVPFWNKELDKGCRLTGIGGSDNHRPMQPLDQLGSIGSPTTVVFATELSMPAILTGIHSGHVFIDLAGTCDRLLEETAHFKDQVFHAGDTLDASIGEHVDFSLRVVAAVGGKIRWREDGEEVAQTASTDVSSTDQTFPWPWVSDGHRHWFRAEVVGADGKTWLLGNPIYVNWTDSNPCNRR
ncbi:MAG TPA: CehA/McbA family metallohydrolase [Terracidiphilus sp.]|nr:CehA/McbA family metallohydrolase [Terracidiphilus sp.]